MRFFLEQTPERKQNDGGTQNNELNGVGGGIPNAYQQGDAAVHHGENLKRSSQAIHQPSCPRAALMRSIPSFTFSREVA